MCGQDTVGVVVESSVSAGRDGDKDVNRKHDSKNTREPIWCFQVNAHKLQVVRFCKFRLPLGKHSKGHQCVCLQTWSGGVRTLISLCTWALCFNCRHFHRKGMTVSAVQQRKEGPSGVTRATGCEPQQTANLPRKLAKRSHQTSPNEVEQLNDE